MLVRNWERRI